MIRVYFTLLLLIFTASLLAQRIDTVVVHSASMNRYIHNLVVVPENHDKQSFHKFPVIYLLNGHGGNHLSFIKQVKNELPQIASEKGIIFVCPNGDNSWYWNSPIDPKFQFETYISKELIEYIDQNYRTINSPKGRAISGFSMGGHGALWNAINHPDIFGACGSMSGGVDIRPFPNSWNMKDRLGKYADNKERWNKHTVIEQLHKIQPNTLSIIIDCGTSDFFFKVNEQLHKRMLEMNIPHDYITRPGAHNSKYWNNALDYQILFFEKFFKK